MVCVCVSVCVCVVSNVATELLNRMRTLCALLCGCCRKSNLLVTYQVWSSSGIRN